MKHIAIFYHCLTHLGDPPELLEHSVEVIRNQMMQLHTSGLLEACDLFIAGINGGGESIEITNLLISPKAHVMIHGLDSRNENMTIISLEKFVKDHQDWYVLYFHSKGASRKSNDEHSNNWRTCMMDNLIGNWGSCVNDLDAGYDSVGCHWMTNQGPDRSQSIWAGNFWWANAGFLATRFPMMNRDRIRLSGVKSIESRYESEVWIGNGTRIPKVKDYHSGWKPTNKDH